MRNLVDIEANTTGVALQNIHLPCVVKVSLSIAFYLLFLLSSSKELTKVTTFSTFQRVTSIVQTIYRYPKYFCLSVGFSKIFHFLLETY